MTGWKLAALTGVVGLALGGGLGFAFSGPSSGSVSKECVAAVEAGDETLEKHNDLIRIMTDVIDTRVQYGENPSSSQRNRVTQTATEVNDTLDDWLWESEECVR